MKSIKLFSALALALAIGFTSCKPKDADVQKKIEEAIKAKGLTNTVTVKDGVATITGVCKDSASRTELESLVKGIKGVKSVTNSAEVTPPPASVAVSAIDPAVQQKIKDGLKDIKTLTVVFETKKAVFGGSCTAPQKVTVMQLCNSAQVPADMSKVVVK